MQLFAMCFPNVVNPAIEPSQTYPVYSFGALWVMIKYDQASKIGLMTLGLRHLLSLSPFQ